MHPQNRLLIAGALMLALLWLGPLPEMAPHAFFAHMTLHMGVVAVAAPLIALGAAGRSWDPVGRLPALFSPIPASIGELIVVWAFHAPALHHWARHAAFGLVVEQALFLVAGLWLWLAAFGGPANLRGQRAGAGVIGMLLTSMHMTLLGALLALAPRTLYDHNQSWRGVTALEDQHLGGAIMLLVGGLAYLMAALWLTTTLLRRVSATMTEAADGQPPLPRKIKRTPDQ